MARCMRVYCVAGESVQYCRISGWLSRGFLAGVLATSAAAALVMQTALVRGAAPQEEPGSGGGDRWIDNEMPVRGRFVGIDPLLAGGSVTTGGLPAGGLAGGCSTTTVAHTLHQFTSGGFIAQGGLVETEIAAVTYTIPSDHFPIRIDRVDGLFGTLNPQGPITTHWSLLVWSGRPNTGIPGGGGAVAGGGPDRGVPGGELPASSAVRDGLRRLRFRSRRLAAIERASRGAREARARG